MIKESRQREGRQEEKRREKREERREEKRGNEKRGVVHRMQEDKYLSKSERGDCKWQGIKKTVNPKC